MKEKFSKLITFFSILFFFFVSLYVFAQVWQEPTASPPNQNVPAPINVSGNSQIKRYESSTLKGWLGIGIPSGESIDSSYLLTVGTSNTAPNVGGIKVTGNSYFQGQVSINGILNMNNQNINNVNKITVNTVDPVFKIGEKQYVTYLPDMVGQKTEVVGEAKLEGGELVIDLANQPEGSDLWLFWQVVDRDSIIPFVFPQDDAALYAFIDGSKFVVKLREGKENAKFSFRLIGTRLDHSQNKSNLHPTQDSQIFIDIDALRQGPLVK